MHNILRTMFSDKNRRKLYIAFALGALVLGATMTGYAAAAVAIPVWLEVANQVFWYIAAAFGVTAASNTGGLVEELPEGIDIEAEDGLEVPPAGPGKHRLEP